MLKSMLYPAIFVNHGGGPLPLLGRQADISNHIKDTVKKWLPKPPKAIVVISAHWESDPIKITSSKSPDMYYDYSGFPPETYEYKYNAPGDPGLAKKIQNLLQNEGLKSELDENRGFDHGVFVPLMLMYPKADIPVVCVSLHQSLDPAISISIGKALKSLREEEILILGSGYTFHNMNAFFNPSDKTHQASIDFNGWLKNVVLEKDYTAMTNWERAPGARISHPREEHLIPLFVVAGAADTSNTVPQVIYDTTSQTDDHAVTSYVFTES